MLRCTSKVPNWSKLTTHTCLCCFLVFQWLSFAGNDLKPLLYWPSKVGTGSLGAKWCWSIGDYLRREFHVGWMKLQPGLENEASHPLTFLRQCHLHHFGVAAKKRQNGAGDQGLRIFLGLFGLSRPKAYRKWVTDFHYLADCILEFHGLNKYWHGLLQSPFESESWEQICSTNRAAIIFNISSVMIVQISIEARGLLSCAGFRFTRTATWHRSLHDALTLMALPGVLPPQARFKSAWQGKMCSAIISFSMLQGWAANSMKHHRTYQLF